MTDPSPFKSNDTDAAVKRPRQQTGQAIAVNMASLLVLSLAGFAIAAAATSLMLGLRTDEAKVAYGLQQLALIQAWFIGVCYGGVSGLAWMAMMFRRRGWMYLAQTLIAVIGGWCIHQFSVHSLERALANTLGLVVLQTAGFHFFPPIGWRWSSREQLGLSRLNEDSAKRQYSIFDVITCTIAMAALFALMRRVELGDAARFYWVVLLWIWIAMPLIAYCVYSMVWPQSGIVRRISWLALGALTSIVISALISLGDYGMNWNVAGFTIENAFSEYARIMAGYLLTLLTFAFAAWLGTPIVTATPLRLHS